MRTAYSVKAVVQGKTVLQRIFFENSGLTGDAIHLKSSSQTDYLLQDLQTGVAPQSLQLRRVGNHLHIRLGKASHTSPDLLIEDYFVFPESKVYGLSASGEIQAFQWLAPDTLTDGAKELFTESGGLTSAAAEPGAIASREPLTNVGYQVTTHNGSFIDGTFTRLGLIAGGTLVLSGAGKSSADAKSAVQLALDRISAYAADGTTAPPKLEDYTTVGASSVDAQNLAAINSAIDAQANASTVDSTAKIQALVNSYVKILAEANGSAADSSPSDDPTLSDYQHIGVQLKSIPSADDGLKLLNDSLKLKTGIALNSIAKIDALALVVDQILNLAASGTVSPSMTETDFTLLGLTGVASSNLGALTSVIVSKAGNISSLNTVAKLQTCLDSYVTILAEANGDVTDRTTANPSAADYENVGITFSVNASSANQLQLLNDVLAAKSTDAIDTYTELTTLAKSVANILDLAAGQDITLKVEDVLLLGAKGVTLNNLNGLAIAIKASANDGSAVNTLPKIQQLLSVEVIKAYATDKTQTVPVLQDYTDAGVQRVDGVEAINASNIDTFNTFIDALTGNDLSNQSQLAAMVASYQKIQNEANGSAADTTAQDPSQQDYSNLGLKFTTANTLWASGVNLLNDVIKLKATSDIDTFTKLNAYRDTIDKLLSLAAASSATGSSLSNNDLANLGLRGLTDLTLSAVIADIQATQDDGSSVDTLSEIQTLISFETILAFANDTQPNKTAGIPVVQDYVDVGVNKVSTENLSAINSAVDTLLPGNFDTKIKLQTVVDSYVRILSEANGPDEQDKTPNDNPTANDYQLIGVNLALAETDANALTLLNDAVANTTASEISTVSRISTLSSLASKVITFASKATGDTSTAGAPSIDELKSLGLDVTTITTEAEVRSVWNAIINSNPVDVNTLSELQQIITNNVVI